MSLAVESPRLFGIGGADGPTSDDYYTPPWLFEQMGITFDLDVCAPPGGIDWIPAARYFTEDDDGLIQPWSGRVWMNPPFSRPSPWADKFRVHADGIAIFPHSAGRWVARLWAAADAWTVVDGIGFVRDGALMPPIPMPVSMAAFGDGCVEAIRRIGPVRRLA